MNANPTTLKSAPGVPMNVPMIQIREKRLTAGKLFELVRDAAAITAGSGKDLPVRSRAVAPFGWVSTTLVAEGATITPEALKLALLKLETNKLVWATYATAELLEDSPMAEIASWTMRPEVSASLLATDTVSRAWLEPSAVLRTVAVISSSAAAVCSRLAACC